MTILEIYTKYKLPPNLQKHMLRVAGLAYLICDSWKGPKIQTELIVKACLLHDLGNIIKFDFDNFPELLGDEEKNIDYWKEVKNEMINKYGEVEEIATLEICRELEITSDILFIVKNWGFKNFERIVNSSNLEWKISVYSDHRISPGGVSTLRDNLENKKKRYSLNKPHSAHVSDKAESLFQSALKVEQEMNRNTEMDLTSITNSMIDLIAARLIEIQF